VERDNSMTDRCIWAPNVTFDIGKACYSRSRVGRGARRLLLIQKERRAACLSFPRRGFI